MEVSQNIPSRNTELLSSFEKEQAGHRLISHRLLDIIEGFNVCWMWLWMWTCSSECGTVDDELDASAAGLASFWLVTSVGISFRINKHMYLFHYIFIMYICMLRKASEHTFNFTSCSLDKKIRRRYSRRLVTYCQVCQACPSSIRR